METTLGIDLASQPANTALCVVAWAPDGRAEVRALARSAWDGTPLHDALLLDAIRGGGPLAGRWGDDGRPVKVGIDAPFGWPEPFVDALKAHHAGGPWPLEPAGARAFALRATDLAVRARLRKTPLSVSTDRIAYPAMRCARLLGELARAPAALEIDRAGSTGRVVETYPDASLRIWLPEIWRLERASYKRAEGRVRRELILAALSRDLGPALVLDDAQEHACTEYDDCLDALVCALVARAARLGLTDGPPDADVELARREGWIHLPHDGSLPSLFARS